MNLLFSCVPYRATLPNTWYDSRRREIAAYVSNRLGILSLANIALAILFAGRNNPLIWITGWSQTTFLALHRWTSRVAVLQAVVHSIIYTVTYFWDGAAAAYRTEAAKPYYWWGIIATVALALAMAHAALPLRQRWYESFLISHVGLTILALVGCWYHIYQEFFHRWGYEVWLYLAFAFWAFDRLARLVRLATWVLFYQNRDGMTASAELIAEGAFIKITFRLRESWTVGPGQHVFLYGLSGFRVWENHPLSIAGWHDGSSSLTSGAMGRRADGASATPIDRLGAGDVEKAVITTVSPGTDGEAKSENSSGDRDSKSDETHSTANVHPSRSISFLVRPQRGMTQILQRRLSRQTPLSSLSMTIMAEGPYGHLADGAKTADHILCIAGGIGITGCLGYVQQYLSERFHQSSDRQGRGSNSVRSMTRATELTLFWSARESTLISAVEEDFLPPLEIFQQCGAEYRIHCTGLATDRKVPRLDMTPVIARALAPGRKTAVIVCAPGSMADAARKILAQHVRPGVEITLAEDAFAW
ncbi:MAG: hypothetical protein M1826_000872 [Phylliscum demangeonii]|nr:MAG: hypothetical protein M1826_000872 [Phylliscum demangeonii]